MTEKNSESSLPECVALVEGTVAVQDWGCSTKSNSQISK